MRLVSTLLVFLFAVVVVVLMAGKTSDLQDTGETQSGAIGTFFVSLMTVWVLLGGLVATFSLLFGDVECLKSAKSGVGNLPRRPSNWLQWRSRTFRSLSA